MGLTSCSSGEEKDGIATEKKKWIASPEDEIVFMASDTAVRWPVFLPLVLFFGGIGAAAAMTQLLGSF